MTFKIAPEYATEPFATLNITDIRVDLQDQFLPPHRRKECTSAVFMHVTPYSKDNPVKPRLSTRIEESHDEMRWVSIFDTFQRMWIQPTFATIELKMGKKLAFFGKYIQNMSANIIFASSMPAVIALILKLAQVSFVSQDFLDMGILTWGEVIGYVPVAIFIAAISIKFFKDQLGPIFKKHEAIKTDWYSDDMKEIEKPENP
jgi:hypothetical protein